MMCSRFMKREPETHGRVYRTIEAGFNAMLNFYRRTLDIVLRHQPITLCVFFATMALTVVMAILIPKGFFPIQDTGLIQGFAEAAQETSPDQMMRLMHVVGDVILADPDVEGFGSQTGSTGSAQTANTGRFFIVLKPRDERKLTASQIIDRLRPQLAKMQGVNLFLQPSQDINVGARIARGSFQYTLQDTNIDELNDWSQKLLEKMRTLPQLADVTSDLLANAPKLQITINRDQASRFGISAQAIDDTLNDAFGQRQITQYFTQLNTYFVVLEILPELQKDLSTLDRLYVKSPLTGAAVPLSALVTVDSNGVGPLLISHQGQFPAVTITFNLKPGVALGQAVDAVNEASREIGMPAAIIPTFQGNAQAFQTSLRSEPALIGAALIVVYIILGILYESFIHPLTILSTLPSAGIGALLALSLGHMDLSVIGIIGIILLIGIVKKNGIMLVDFAISAERDRHMAPHDAIREACLLALPPDPDDDGGRHARRHPARSRQRHRLGNAPAARLRHGRRAGAEPGADALHHAGGLSLSRPPADLAVRREARPGRGGRRAGARGGGGINRDLRRIRRPHAAGYLDAPVALDHGDVELTLQVQPELRAIAEIAAKADRGIGGDRSPAVQDVGDAAGRHADIERQPIGAQCARAQFALQQTAGMHGARHGIYPL